MLRGHSTFPIEQEVYSHEFFSGTIVRILMYFFVLNIYYSLLYRIIFFTFPKYNCKCVGVSRKVCAICVVIEFTYSIASAILHIQFQETKYHHIPKNSTFLRLH